MTSGRQREVCERLEQDAGSDGSDLSKGVVVAGAEWHDGQREAGRERHDLN
jgi:hypothetical protein